MDFNFNTVIAAIAVLIAGAALFDRMLGKSLSLREHQEFKETARLSLDNLKKGQDERLVIREFNAWKEQVNRDFDRLEADLRIIDETKPSAGELQEAMKAVDSRVTHLETVIRDFRNNHH